MVNNGQNLVNVVKERSLCRIGLVSTSINLCTALNRVEGRDIEFTWFQGCSLKLRMHCKNSKTRLGVTRVLLGGLSPG